MSAAPSQGEMKGELVDLVLAKAYRFGDFTLSSGRKSQHYINGKLVLLEPRGAELFARWILEDVRGIQPPPVAVGGLELGAVPVACSVMDFSDGRLRTFIVRKQKKGHGTSQQIEGVLESGERVIVVDDVITTGAATLAAIEAVEARGGVVAGIYCLVDRQEGTLPELAERGIKACMTLDDLLARSAAS